MQTLVPYPNGKKPDLAEVKSPEPSNLSGLNNEGSSHSSGSLREIDDININ